MKDMPLEYIHDFIYNYGEAKKWNLALKYKVLFMVICKGVDKGTIESWLAGVLHDDIVFPLSQIQNSGVSKGKSDIKDKHWSDSTHCTYRCGNVEIVFDCETEYKKGWKASDWYCNIHTIKEQ